MIRIGCHLSASFGFTSMIKTAQQIGANTFQYFTRNPRGGKARNIDLDDLKNFLKISEEDNFRPVMAHAPYTLNLCSSTEHIRNFSKNTLKDDISRTELIPNSFYNFHPGSHTGQGIETGIEQIAGALNDVLIPNQTTVVLLETMTGKGSEVGGKFEDLKSIIDRVELKDKVGICFDTCHVFDAGYDIVNELESVIKEFDRIVGLEKIKAIHLNDSKNLCGSRKDRHEQIGKGNIGLNAFRKIINHPVFHDLPFVLETPQEDISGYSYEITLLRGMEIKDKNDK